MSEDGESVAVESADGASEPTSEKLVELAKRRGYFFQSSGAYGGVGGFYTFGPQGAALKGNVEDAWRDRFAVAEGNMEIDAPTIMPEPVFEASGHLDGFDDMLIECPECATSTRADHLVEDNTEYEDAESLPIPEVEEIIAEYELVCPECGTGLADVAVEDFNLMFATNIGPGDADPGYMRPETAQGIFVEFPRLKEYARNQLPFGVTQIGRAYRNEISPRRSIIRTREFTQAELEYFVDPEDDEPDLESVADVEVTLYPASEQNDENGDEIETTIGDAVEEGIIGDEWVAYFLGVAKPWYDAVGVDMDRFRFRQHLSGERAHYAADCWDAESEIDGSEESQDSEQRKSTESSSGYWIEMAGFAYRGDYDLSKHEEYSDDRFTIFKQYDEPKTVERATVDPDMSYLGPEFGGAAQDVVSELEALAERDRSAFEDAAQSAAEDSSGDDEEPRDGDAVEIDLEGESHEIPLEKTGFSVDEETIAGEHVTPHVVEPSFGVDRLVYTVLHHAYREDEVDGEERTYLELDPEVAPTFVGVFPLQNDADLEATADEIVDDLREAGLSVTYDDSGNIGRRYRRQDEVGTPFCVTIDYETIENEETTVTVRERDTTAQKRLPIEDLAETLTAIRAGDLAFEDV